MDEKNDFAEYHKLLKEEIVSLKNQDRWKKLQSWLLVIINLVGLMIIGWQKLNAFEIIDKAREIFVSKEVNNQTISTLQKDISELKQEISEVKQELREKNGGQNGSARPRKD